MPVHILPLSAALHLHDTAYQPTSNRKLSSGHPGHWSPRCPCQPHRIPVLHRAWKDSAASTHWLLMQELPCALDRQKNYSLCAVRHGSPENRACDGEYRRQPAKLMWWHRCRDDDRLRRAWHRTCPLCHINSQIQRQCNDDIHKDYRPHRWKESRDTELSLDWWPRPRIRQEPSQPYRNGKRQLPSKPRRAGYPPFSSKWKVSGRNGQYVQHNSPRRSLASRFRTSRSVPGRC